MKKPRSLPIKMFSLERIFLANMLQSAWLDSQPQKTKKRGRKSDQATSLSKFCGFDVLADDFRAAIKRFGAPPEWESELQFLLGCLIFPRRVDAAKIKGKKVTLGIVLKPGSKMDERIIHSTRLTHIFAQNPPKFLRLMLEIGCIIEKKFRSPKQQTMMALAGSKRGERLKATQIAKAVKSGKTPVTEKVVEKARAGLRSKKGF